MVLGMSIGTALQFANKIHHPLATDLITRSGIDGHRCKIVTSHMTIKTIPVRIGLRLRSEASLFEIWRQQTVAIILQQRLDIQVTRRLQRTFQQGDIP